MTAEALLGPLPDAWEQTTLGEACRRGGGDVQTGPFGSQLHAADYVLEGIPSIMPQNIGDNRVIEEGIARISAADAARLARYLVRKGDIVYSRRGDVERRALIGEKEDGWLCGTGCLRVRFGNGDVDPRYASYYFGHPNVRQWIVRHAQGATMPNLNTSILSELPFVAPPPTEQRAIAHILGSLDDKIELNRRMNETLQAVARAIFKSWFVDFDPVRAKASGEQPESICRRLGLTTDLLALFPDRFRNSELGEAPEGWDVTTLGGLCERISMGPFGSDIKTSNFVHQGVPIIRGGNITDGFVDEKFVFLTESKADELRNANARAGDIVITHRGTLGQVGLIPEGSQHPRYVVSQSQMVLTVRKERTTPRFIYEFLRSPTGQQALLANTSQVGVPAIARPTTSVKAITLVSPLPPLLRAYDSATAPLFERVHGAIRESSTLVALRDALLPRLLSGELRVPLPGEA